MNWFSGWWKKTKTEQKAGIPAEVPLEAATTQPPANKNLSPAMLRIIRPEAQPRWLLPTLSTITPQYLEAVLRGALTGNHVFQWELFDLMEDTWPRLVKNLNELKSSAIAHLQEDWQLQPYAVKGKPPTPEAVDRAELVKEALLEMPGDASRDENSFDETCYDILDAWAKGTSLLEIIWEVREREGGGEIQAPQSTSWVHPTNYAWDGARLGLLLQDAAINGRRTDGRMPSYSNPGTSQLEELPPDKFLVCVRKAKTGHPLGGPLLRSLAWWWCAANFSADWLLNFAQVFGLPIRWANYADNASQETINAINAMLENMGSMGYGSFPAGTSIELKEAGKSGDQLPQASILDRADKQCDLLILGQTLTTQVSKEGGSRALGEVHENVLDKVVHAAAKYLARVLNRQMIPSVCRLNYGDTLECPRFVPEDEDLDKGKSKAEVIQIAVATGIPVPVNFALEKLNIPKAEAGEQLIEMPSTAQPGMPGDTSGDGGQANGAAYRNGNGPAVAGLAAHRANPALSGDEEIVLQARDAAATEKVIDHALENLTGVEARWLGGVKPFFQDLVLKAQNADVSDADFNQALDRARRQIPELFGNLKSSHLQTAMEEAMGAAVVNGALRGHMKRPVHRGGKR